MYAKEKKRKGKAKQNEKENHELGTSGLDRGFIIGQATQRTVSSEYASEMIL